ncbi:MAG: DNA polymerase IV [Candidatus Heimdallarchaeota archaeon]
MALIQQTKVVEENNDYPQEFLFHVDLDCFYAAVEMREDPTLVGKPIIVGGDKETKRGVVLTCNYEARKFGLHSGMPVRKALELCPEALCVSSHRSMYKEVSKSIMAVLSSYTDAFRSASIDEAYLNLTKEVYENYNGNPIPFAQEIKDEIFEEERITCSIGIGPNTSIAKIATSQNKPDGITYVQKEKIKEFLYPLNVRRLSGIGPKSATSLKNKHNIETIGQIIDIGTEYEMIRKFGDFGKFFYRIISGQGRTVVEPSNSYGVKSISRGKTFYGFVKDGEPVTAEKLLPKLIENVHDRLKKRLFRFKTVTLEVKLQQGLRTLNRSRSFLAANDDKERIITTAFDLLNEVKKQHPKQPIRKIAIRVSNFERSDPQQKKLADFFK